MQNIVRLALGDELPGDPEDPRDRATLTEDEDSVDASMASTMNAPAPPWRTPSSAVTTRAWRAASASMSGSGGDTTRTSHTVAATPFGQQLVGGQQAGFDELAHPEQADGAVARSAAGGRAAPAHLALVNVAGGGLGEADGGGPRELEGGAQHRADLLGRRWGEDRHAGDGEGQRHVEDAVMARPVVAGDAGPVQHEDDRAAVEPDIEVGLVEGAAEERGVHRDDGPDARHAHAGGRGHLVLFGDPHVEEAVGEAGPGRAAARWARAWPP